ncbi:hypothetical protein [Glutamicibacter sp. V16R2B1]|uniref:hypothetical protein n=1 Tax=Glutamicibacter sp. V16R2B1 TaxID=2036207 RepID=UPI0010FDC53D|nr:hypothetical protein [Glutamicibacter sp. V16R2B1]TLK48791.1 hypothetical protein FDN03_14440 [Glutamicibacter sp. V16R2B1]
MISKVKNVVVLLVSVGLLVGCNPEVRDQRLTDQGNSTTTAPLPPQSYQKAESEFVQKFNQRPKGRAMGVTVKNSFLGTNLDADNIGISFEATELTDARWDPELGNLDEMLQALGNPGLRFGGNGLDRKVFWSSTGESAPKGKTLITPEDLRRVMKTVRKIDAKVTIGVPLGTFDPARSADMAKYAMEIFGRHLIGISIGNEPNGFTKDTRSGLQVRTPGSWDKNQYVTEVRSYINAIDAVVDAEAPIIGPGVFEGTWMDAFLAAKIPNSKALTQHYYATYMCSSTVVPGRGPEWENLLNPVVEESSHKMFGVGLAKARKAKLPLWVEETGPTSCPGTNSTSKTHATTLWTVDHIFSAARQGVERMNMHSMLGACRGGAPMSVICSSKGTGTQGSGKILPQPSYQAMRIARVSAGGKFLVTKVTGDERLRAYAIEDRNGNILVTIVNKNDAAKSSANSVTVNVPKEYHAARATQVYGVSNGVVNGSEHVDLSPFSENGSGVKTNLDGKLLIDLVSSSVTTIEFTKIENNK